MKSWEINPDEEYAAESEKMGWFDIDMFSRAKLFFGFTPELKSKVKKAATS